MSRAPSCRQSAPSSEQLDDPDPASELVPASGDRTAGGRFAKGKSGNPKGRPPKPREQLNDVVLRVLYEPVPVGPSGQQGTMIAFEALVRAALGHAIKDPRLSISLIKAFLGTFGTPEPAGTQDNDEHEADVLARFRERELRRLAIVQASGDAAALDRGSEASDEREGRQERSP
jgi:hypothetical protein